ncbi:Fungal pheromone STE3 GPCR [Penicillium concentricum]|uniref:Fungal pheromone STE3 GPCR n=1 Tax=Penicillium concentricum TaxID=293559 RepID=A0A9W9UWR0_9EURO|nr:Fungal pheromone STE3 GPCR [Penicillium concentricum]KAJ5360368.1 Fungal pheromone STE3 GPCR [Penicillium concentricum]
MDTYHRRPQAVVLPILSSLSIALAIPPLILHGKNRNFPATTLIFWSILLNLFNIINSLIWPTDDVKSWWDGAGLCDIEVKFMAAGYVGIPGSLACIFRSLAIVLDTDRATLVPSKGQRWRNQFVEILFCVAVPAIAMITHIIWQRSRYLLFAISGCVNNFDESWVSLVFAWIWPPIICLIAAYYCCLVLIRVHKYRSDFANIIRASSSNLSKSRFLRLFFLALSMLICILPLQGYVVYNDIRLSLPWHSYSWSEIHNEGAWHTIVKYPIDGTVFFDRWTPVASGFMIFIFFGFGRDATRMYRTVFWYLGLSYCFSSIEPPTDTNNTPSPGHASTATTLVGSIGSRARSLFSRQKESVATFISTHGTYNDLEKGTSSHLSRHSSGKLTKKSRWSSLPWSLFNRRQTRQDIDGTLLTDLAGPSQTVCTNAWASRRDSREVSSGPTSPELDKDFIHVRQVISQQSEVRVQV